MNTANPSLECHEYGNTSKMLPRFILVGVSIGLFALVAGLGAAYFENRLDRISTGQILALLLGPGVIMLLGILPTLLFRIHIRFGRVQQVFLGRFIVSDYPKSGFIRIVRGCRGCAAVLYFAGDRKIHLFGAHMGEIARLTNDLTQHPNEPQQSA